MVVKLCAVGGLVFPGPQEDGPVQWSRGGKDVSVWWCIPFHPLMFSLERVGGMDGDLSGIRS